MVVQVTYLYVKSVDYNSFKDMWREVLRRDLIRMDGKECGLTYIENLLIMPNNHPSIISS